MLQIKIDQSLDLRQLDNISKFVEEKYTSQALEINPNVVISQEEYTDFNEALYNLVDECFYGHTRTNSKSHDNSDKKIKKDLFMFKYMKENQFSDYDFNFNTVDFSWKEKFNLVYKILRSNLKKHSYYLVVIIYLINNNYLENLIFRKNETFHKFFLESPLVEVIKLMFIALQLKDDATNLGEVWRNFCQEVIYKTLFHSPYFDAITEKDINTSFYTEGFMRKKVYIDKIFVQVVIDEFLNCVKLAKDFSTDFSTNEINEVNRKLINMIEKVHPRNPLPQILHTQIHYDKKYSYNWIIQSRSAGEGILCPSEYTKIVQSYHIERIYVETAPDDMTNSTQFVTLSKPSATDQTTSLISYPEHVLKCILGKFSNAELLNMITINKSFAKIICEFLYYRPCISSKTKMRKFESSIFYSLTSSTIFPYHTFVKRLNFSFFNINIEPASLRLLGACSSSERLTMIRLNRITGRDIAVFVRNLKPNILTSVDVTNTPSLNGHEVQALIDNCNLSLQGLYMPNSQCSSEVLNKLFETCRNLKRIRLMEAVFLTNDNLITMSQNLHKIVELDISECQNVNSHAVYKALSGMSNIRDFVVNGCKNLDNRFIGMLYENDVHLRKLKNFNAGNLNPIYSFQDRDIDHLVWVAPNIKHLTLAKHSDLTDSALRYIGKLSKTLTTLNIGHLNQITSLGISYIINCGRLTYLDLSACDNITSDGFILLSTFKRLKRIGMVKCLKLDDYTLVKFLAKSTAQLERVHLSYCPQLTAFSILELLRRHPKLQHLSVSGIPAIQSLLPQLRMFSRPAPYEFTSEQTASFAIFSGIKNIAHVKEILGMQLVGKSLTDQFIVEDATKHLFESYLKYRGYEDLNYKNLLRYVLVPFVNTCLAYDFISNKYTSDAIYQEEAAIRSELAAIFNYINSNVFYNSTKVFDFLNDEKSNGKIDYTLPISNLNCSLKDLKCLPNYLLFNDSEKESKKLENKQDLYKNSDLKKLFKENNEWIYYIMEYLECWKNNLFCYISIRDQRSSFQQFKKIDVSMKHMKVLYRNLNMLKDNTLHSEFILYASQVAPIVDTIVKKFEQITFVTLLKEFITLEYRIEKFDLYDKHLMIEALTRDLRKAILDFRNIEYKAISDTSSEYCTRLEKIIIEPSTYYDDYILKNYKHENIMVFPGFRFEKNC